MSSEQSDIVIPEKQPLPKELKSVQLDNLLRLLWSIKNNISISSLYQTPCKSFKDFFNHLIVTENPDTISAITSSENKLHLFVEDKLQRSLYLHSGYNLLAKHIKSVRVIEW